MIMIIFFRNLKREREKEGKKLVREKKYLQYKGIENKRRVFVFIDITSTSLFQFIHPLSILFL